TLRGLVSGTSLFGAMMALGCGEPAEPYRYLSYESRATGEVRQASGGEVRTWDVAAHGEGLPCVFTHDVLDGTGFFDIACGEDFYFSDDSDAIWLDGDQELSSSPTRIDGTQVARMTAQLVITESVGEINQQTHFVPADYLRRYTVTGELDCDADPELGCEGVWSFELVGEQTKDDVAFRTGDPY